MSWEVHHTLCVLYNMGMPKYAFRSGKFQLTPRGGEITESINGEAFNMMEGFEQFNKYEIEIACTDVEAVSLDGVWRGRIIGVDWPAELSYVTESGGPARQVVPESSRVDGDITFYRPHFMIMVTDFDQQFEEWKADYSWRLRGVEVRVP